MGAFNKQLDKNLNINLLHILLKMLLILIA